MTERSAILLVGTPGPLLVRLESALAELGPVLVLASLGGDVTAIDFGLSGAEYRALLGSTSQLVVAVTPDASFSGDVERSRSVRAAAECLEFVRSGGAPRGVVFLSSLLIFGNAAAGAEETAFQVGQGFSGHFEESLAVAERVIRHAANLAPLRILRTAPFVGDIVDRQLSHDSPLSEVCARVERAPGVSETTFSDLPVRFETTDRAALALSRLVREAEAVTVHLVDANAFTDRQLLDWLGDRAAREFRQHLPGSRGRRQKSPLENLSFPERRAFSGWGLRFSRDNAERLFPELLDRAPGQVLEALLGPSAEAEASR